VSKHSEPGKIMRSDALVAVGAMDVLVVRDQEERKATKKKKVRYMYGNTAANALEIDDEA